MTEAREVQGDVLPVFGPLVVPLPQQGGAAAAVGFHGNGQRAVELAKHVHGEPQLQGTSSQNTS